MSFLQDLWSQMIIILIPVVESPTINIKKSLLFFMINCGGY